MCAYVCVYSSLNDRDGIVPCKPQLPTLKTVSTPEGDKTRGLGTCFPTDCACRKTEKYGNVFLNAIVLGVSCHFDTSSFLQ